VLTIVRVITNSSEARMHKYPHFVEALRNLAPTNRERAARMSVSVRAVNTYFRGTTLSHVLKVKQIPELDDALTRDIRPAVDMLVSV